MRSQVLYRAAQLGLQEQNLEFVSKWTVIHCSLQRHAAQCRPGQLQSRHVHTQLEILIMHPP